MVNLFATPRLQPLLQKYRAFVEDELYRCDLDLVQTPFFTAEPKLAIKRARAKELGLWAPHLPVSDGGLGLTLTEFGQVSEILGTSPFGHYVCNCQAPDIGNMELMHQFASPALQEKYLKPLMRGDIRSCFSMTEPGLAGSNPVEMSTSAYREGDEYVISGHKWFTTAADGAAFSIVMAVTDPEAAPHARASMLIVPTNTAGFRFCRNIPVMGEAGEGYMSHAEIIFENCRVPATNLVGLPGEGFRLAQERLGPGRIHHCMRWIGICERAFSLMCERVMTRSMGDGTMLADKQVVMNWIAESRASIDAARYYVLHTADMIEKNGAKSARHQISAIKFFVADVLMKVLDRAIQAHGALGITEDTLLSHWYRHERGARIYDGPDEVHKQSLARAILKKMS